jgi:hypothetical protein
MRVARVEYRGQSDCRQPLSPGDTVELNVQGIGTLTNRIAAGPNPIPPPTARRVDHSTER